MLAVGFGLISAGLLEAADFIEACFHCCHLPTVSHRTSLNASWRKQSPAAFCQFPRGRGGCKTWVCSMQYPADRSDDTGLDSHRIVIKKSELLSQPTAYFCAN